MPATIDATVGGASANSYVSLAEALAYYETIHWFEATWTGLADDTARTQRLIEAARALEVYDYTGGKVAETQALSFPRSTQDDTAIIPPEVKQAQLEVLLYQERERDADTGQREPGIKSFSAAGKVSVEFETGGRTPRDTGGLLGASEDRIRQLLRHWLAAGSGANNIAMFRV